MYETINKGEDYRLVNLETKRHMTFRGRRALYAYVKADGLWKYTRHTKDDAPKIHREGVKGYDNAILTDINITGNDTIMKIRYGKHVIGTSPRTVTYAVRKYMVLDGYDRVIDIRDDIEGIENQAENGEWCFKKVRVNYQGDYRKDGVVGTGKRLIRKSDRGGYTQPRGEKKQQYVEGSEYVRAKRKMSTFVCGEGYSRVSKSWKDQTKKQNQWM